MATKEEKQDQEGMWSVLEFSGQGEQRCSDPSVVCLGDTEDSQKGESCNNQDSKEQKQKTQGSLWHLWTEDDRWN